MPRPDCRLGIDVGGTNTDAVIMDPADRVMAKAKVPCTPDITGGITRAVDTVLRAPGADPRRITHVMRGQVDKIFQIGEGGRRAALDEASEEASERAVAAGADPGTVQIVELEEISLTYLTAPSVRIRAKPAGALGGLPEQHLQARIARQARLASPPSPAEIAAS